MKVSLKRSLKNRAHSELLDLHDIWAGGVAPNGEHELHHALREKMQDGRVALAVRARLKGAATPVFIALMESDNRTSHFDEIRDYARREGVSATAVRAALADLVSLGLAANLSLGHDGHTSSVWGVPEELAVAIQATESNPIPASALLTLHGHLHHMFQREDVVAEDAEAQVMRMYRFLADEAAILKRVEELSDEVKDVFVQVVTKHGGILPLGELPGITKLPLDKICEDLEEASLGAHGTLSLEKFGIRQRGQVLAIFNEAVLAWFKFLASKDNREPAASASIGVDFVSNFDRFANFVDDESIRFTVRGTIFKSTGKRLAERLIPNPGREFKKLEILEMEYRFALAYRLIDRTGARTFRVTKAGKEFLNKSLLEKQRIMTDCLVEDRDMPGDVGHQIQMRRRALAFLKKFEPTSWYDAMALAFVSRNHYLACLGDQEENQSRGDFPVRASADLDSLVWNLFTWIRKHLYLLGFIDLGYDHQGRAESLRLTAIGAEFLGTIPATELADAGHLVVNPDYEIVLFPGEGAHGLIYLLDRFCEREKSDSLYHYRLTPAALHRALSEGMSLDEIHQVLLDYSRTPIPQNVEFSLESWAKSGGMVTWETDSGKITCESGEILDRIEVHPELGKLGLKRDGRNCLWIKGKADEESVSSWIQDYGVSVRLRKSE